MLSNEVAAARVLRVAAVIVPSAVAARRSMRPAIPRPIAAPRDDERDPEDPVHDEPPTQRPPAQHPQASAKNGSSP